MRAIKFRAWYGKERRMLTNVAPGTIIYFDDDGNAPASECELMQYTGLHDKTGKDIYEGDVVKTKWQVKAEMVWVDEEAAFGLRTIDEVVEDEIMWGFKYTEMEVIGDIHNNPELLVNEVK